MDTKAIREKYGEGALDLLTDALLGRMASRAKELRTKGAVSATGSQNYLHGPGSLLGVLGLSTPIMNAMVLPLNGVQAELPYMRSNLEDPLLPILTGISASTGSEPTSNCTDGKQPGQLQIVNQTYPFGRIQMDSQVLDVSQAGRLINRGEFVDMNVIGDPFRDVIPTPPVSPQNALKDEVSKKMTELFTRIYMDYGHLSFDGNPVNTASSSGGYLEWLGLDSLLNTGKQDAMTGIKVPAADSIVQSFGSVTMDSNAQPLVTYISQIVRALDYLATRTGNGSLTNGTFQLKIAMRYSAFLKLTEVWPCAYFTTMCTNLQTGSTQFVDAQRQLDLRDEMRKGQYLITVFGHQIQVIIDDYITETIPVSGTMQSDMYFIPTVAAGTPITYFEYFDFNGPNAAVEMGNLMALPGTFSVTGDGQFLLIKKPVTNTCVQVEAIAKKRLICRAPFLGARLTNCRYTVIEHERNWMGATPASSYGYQPGTAVGYNYPPYWYPQS